MIIVTGTKRSGTSMWMQVLQAAGLPVIGEAFPLNWGETLREANPAGFFESILRKGIYWETNPHRGVYLDPDATRNHAVKVFIPGLIRTDRAFMHRVVATMRGFREYDASIRRLYFMGRSAREAKNPSAALPVQYTEERMDPVLEWWAENFSLISDIVTRRYPVHLTAYEETLADPERVVSEALAWLGQEETRASVAAVEEQARAQEGDSLAGSAGADLDPDIIQTFDDLYQHVLERRVLEGPFIERLNEVQQRLLPRFREHAERVVAHERARREEARRRAAASRDGGKGDPE